MWNSRPPPLRAKAILNFHFDYLKPSLIYIAGGVTNNRRCPQNPAPWIHVKREHGRGTNARNMVKSAR